MADQTITAVSAPQAAIAPAVTKAPEAAAPKAEPPKSEANGTIGTTEPNIGAGTKVNYYA